MILSYQRVSVVTTMDATARHTSLCQQKVEKIMPTYVHGTVMPEMSDLMYRRSESERMGILFRFQGSLEYGFIGWVSRVGIALHVIGGEKYHSVLSIVRGRKVVTFRVWWNAHRHRTQFPPFHAAIVRAAKTRARRHSLSHARHQI